MKENLINDFNDYLKTSHIWNVRVSRKTNDEIHIKTSLINYKIMIDIILLGFACYGTYSIDNKVFYVLPIISVFLILIIMIWYDFISINNVKIDLKSKTLEVKNRNIFQFIIQKFIFKNKNIFKFVQINSLSIRSNESFQTDFLRYFVNMKVDNNRILPLVSFENEEAAYKYAGFITSVIKNYEYI